MESTKELYSVVRSLGEDISITQTINNAETSIGAKMSVVPAARATYNLVDRAFLLSGSLALNVGENHPPLEGAYITRALEPNSKYLIYSKVFDSGCSELLSDIFCSKCTDVIKLKRKSKSYDSWGNVEETYNDFAINVYACCNTTPKNLKITTDGKIDQSYHNLVIPSRFMLSRGDRIVKTGFVAGLEKLLEYEIESVETSLIEKTEVGNYLYGVAQYQARYIGETTEDKYSVTISLNNCTANKNNPTKVSDYNYAELTFVPQTGYEMPRNITVTNAEYVWDCVHGKLILFKATGNVSVSITAISEYQPPTLENDYLTISQA